jgi:hypothetical protein
VDQELELLREFILPLNKDTLLEAQESEVQELDNKQPTLDTDLYILLTSPMI